ncbi:N-acetylmuramoyl-L-alanine amidase [Roseobacter sp. YSTF-M11]|uniref:N-acetylmuramoyl-L-alanine amidase n=1 Tax=Roseobacter insulae TaxID=2859783 RepID=A0A9X1FTC0_9RHOB|nr:N-acetylmuramoyl-L-alanine amidase [Roseobacter insulae]MBW4707171.1 N-acetylmuramoyl-L-alanine amidase [Roseobacter insulae]
MKRFSKNGIGIRMLAAVALSVIAIGSMLHAHGSDEQEQGVAPEIANSALARVGGLTEYFDSTVDMDADMAPPFVGEIIPIADMVSNGDTSTLYDVILQPGHYGRTSGSTGGGGALISEQKLAAGIVERLASRLKELGHSVAVIPADGFARPLKGYVFLSIHADGSSSPCASAPSLGYDDGSDLLGMHLVAYGLGTSLGYTYNEFMNDNFTANLSSYYVYKHIKSRIFEGVLEVGELSCPEEEQLLIDRKDIIADNLAYALDAAVTIGKLAGR